MIFNLGYYNTNFGAANGYIHKNNGDHYNCLRYRCYLVATWQRISAKMARAKLNKKCKAVASLELTSKYKNWFY